MPATFGVDAANDRAARAPSAPPAPLGDLSNISTPGPASSSGRGLRLRLRARDQATGTSAGPSGPISIDLSTPEQNNARNQLQQGEQNNDIEQIEEIPLARRTRNRQTGRRGGATAARGGRAAPAAARAPSVDLSDSDIEEVIEEAENAQQMLAARPSSAVVDLTLDSSSDEEDEGEVAQPGVGLLATAANAVLGYLGMGTGGAAAGGSSGSAPGRGRRNRGGARAGPSTTGNNGGSNNQPVEIEDDDDDDLQITSVRLAPPAPRPQYVIQRIAAPFPYAVTGPTAQANRYVAPAPAPPRVSSNLLAQIQSLAEEEKETKRVELRCAICLSLASEGTELSSTICGHIFCAECIQAALKAPGGKKCPVCRKSLAGKNSIHRLYYG